MITLEKIIELDEKINRAVKVIESLRDENRLLRDKIYSYRTKIDNLEGLVSTFKDDQDEIEAGIKNAVNTLSTMLNQALESYDEEGKSIVSELKASITTSDQNTENSNTSDNPMSDTLPLQVEEIIPTQEIKVETITENTIVEPSLDEISDNESSDITINDSIDENPIEKETSENDSFSESDNDFDDAELEALTRPETDDKAPEINNNTEELNSTDKVEVEPVILDGELDIF